MGEPDIVYSLSIGDTFLKSWSSTEDAGSNGWDDPDYLYELDHREPKSSSFLKRRASSAKKEPPLRSKRISVPFEFRFVS